MIKYQPFVHLNSCFMSWRKSKIHNFTVSSICNNAAGQESRCRSKLCGIDQDVFYSVIDWREII